ncbi:copper transporter [Kineococcus gypseus]|uniref:copper transporter n=1 Tax=Kineococcus gypseus TaxID=1637102 RepID=UPI003D7E171F
MIDFRYHVVSLVSVFLALAVGIVLGAGPLNEGISTGITDQVRQLTQSRDQLRAERDQALTTGEAQDAWAEAVSPALVDGQLAGRAVAVVELPGADSGQADAVVEALLAAGGTVSARVTVQDEWTAEEGEQARRGAAEQLAARPGEASAPAPAQDGSGEGAGDGSAEVLAAALARALVTPDLAQTVVADPATGEVLAALGDAGLVEVDGDVTERGTLALVVAGAGDPDTSEAQAEVEAAAWDALARQLDGASAGAVVAGPTQVGESTGAVAAVRADSDLADRVSTSDDVDSAVGRVNAVLALREQLSGGAGHYGTTASATAVAPPLPQVAR